MAGFCKSRPTDTIKQMGHHKMSIIATPLESTDLNHSLDFGPLCTQSLIETLGSMVIFDENQAVSDINT